MAFATVRIVEYSVTKLPKIQFNGILRTFYTFGSHFVMVLLCWLPNRSWLNLNREKVYRDLKTLIGHKNTPTSEWDFEMPL